MTIRAFVLILSALLLASLWLGVIYVINMFAGNPFWDVIGSLYWPVGIPAGIMILLALRSQLSFWQQRKRGQPLPAIVPISTYLLVAGVLFGIVALGWLMILFDSYYLDDVLYRIHWPLLLLVLSGICMWFSNRKR